LDQTVLADIAISDSTTGGSFFQERAFVVEGLEIVNRILTAKSEVHMRKIHPAKIALIPSSLI
jgi:hypothetical protein